MKKHLSEPWYDESGMTNDWLKENDPLWNQPWERDYLTARQYRRRAREREIPVDPDKLKIDLG